MRIFFIGTVSFSRMALKKIISMKAEVVGVATKSKSAFNADFESLSEVCERENITYKYVKDINAPHIIEWIKSLKPDVIFCFGWSSLIKKELLNLTPIGVVGYHPTELPKNRGRHPLIWTLVLGLETGASTFFFMEEGADDGDILSQEKIHVAYEDDAASLYAKLKDKAVQQIEDFLPKLQNGSYTRTKQNHEEANLWRKRGMKDGEIDFRMSSFAIYNLVRALTKPYIGAHVLYNDEEVKIWKVEEVDFPMNNLEPGKVLKSDEDGILVKTYDGAIRILEHEFEQLPEKNGYL